MESRKHRKTAELIAAKKGVQYDPSKGADIVTPQQVIEVETKGLVKDAIRQLQGYRKPVYIAGVDDATVAEALEATKNTSIGVMNNQVKILKRSKRGAPANR